MKTDQINKAIDTATQVTGKPLVAQAQRQLAQYNKALAAADRAQATLDKVTAKHHAALQDRDKALRLAHAHGATVRQLAKIVNLSPAAVSKAVRRTQ